jgi:CBS domain containing-hemolysin-like protein
MPVSDGQQIVGNINLFDVLAAPPVRHCDQVQCFMRPPTFITENVPLTEIFPRLRLSRQPMCLVTNARADVVGLVTTEDILQHIVGTM